MQIDYTQRVHAACFYDAPHRYEQVCSDLIAHGYKMMSAHCGTSLDENGKHVLLHQAVFLKKEEPNDHM